MTAAAFDFHRFRPLKDIMDTSRFTSSPLLPLAARVLLAVLFLLSGLGKLAAPGPTQGYIASMGLPFPLMAYCVAVLIEVGGSLLLIAGYRTRFVALVLAVFSIVTAAVFHHMLADQNQMIHFFKNIAIAGGLLQVAAFGAGRISFDRC
jgi:putative oxidoreductase